MALVVVFIPSIQVSREACAKPSYCIPAQEYNERYCF
jgi:hypothetical protein